MENQQSTDRARQVIRVDRYVCYAAVIGKSGQSQFAPLKLRSLALVPSSRARCAPSNFTYGSSTARLQQDAPAGASRILIANLRSFRAPASPACMRPTSTRISGVQVPGPVPSSGQPAAGLSPPGRKAPFPPNKRKAVARLLPVPHSGCLPLPLPSHTQSRQETRPRIPPGPPRGR